MALNSNISELPEHEQQAIHNSRMDCLMKHKLRLFRDNRLEEKAVKAWFYSMPEAWKNTDDRENRMKNAIKEIKGYGRN